MKILRIPVLLAIRGYQKTLSPDHGWLSVLFPQGFCRFSPSCSQYVYESVENHGLVCGLFGGLWRILRCNPWNAGGYDPVKKK